MIDFIDRLIEDVDEFLTMFLPPLCALTLLNIFFQIIT